MVKRKQKSSPHDAAVRREANRLRRQGWNVKAAVSGYPQPSSIGKEKKIPDIEAKKERSHSINRV